MGKYEPAGQDFSACRDFCAWDSTTQPPTLTKLQTRFALRRKSFPAERTCFDKQSRRHPMVPEGALNEFHKSVLRGLRGANCNAGICESQRGLGLTSQAVGPNRTGFNGDLRLMTLSQGRQLTMNDARSDRSEFLTGALHFAQCRLFSRSMKTL